MESAEELITTKVNVAGYGLSVHYRRARDVANLLKNEFSQYDVQIHAFDRSGFFNWLNQNRGVVGTNANKHGETATNHATSPIVWLEEGTNCTFIGGRDRFVEWVHENHPNSQADVKGQESLCIIL
eukprot:TRINITY_DN3530_c0_g1_i1.p1 TRINITY_DN3530_c0_g1~~TRINITY_DN3530_c0_g1_i1.p1  ORF type:complete len:126 (+),score=18.76 TRINITY_DN3530_c0_g1_i1:40-417(+)